MPLGDGMGPEGEGPLSGRRKGYGAGYNHPGYYYPGRRYVGRGGRGNRPQILGGGNSYQNFRFAKDGRRKQPMFSRLELITQDEGRTQQTNGLENKTIELKSNGREYYLKRA